MFELLISSENSVLVAFRSQFTVERRSLVFHYSVVIFLALRLFFLISVSPLVLFCFLFFKLHDDFGIKNIQCAYTSRVAWFGVSGHMLWINRVQYLHVVLSLCYDYLLLFYIVVTILHYSAV